MASRYDNNEIQKLKNGNVVYKSKVYPNFEEEDIKRLVKVLYDKGQKEDADRIHTIYMANGYEFLKLIYEKYQKG